MPSEGGDDDGSFNEPGNSTVCDDVAPDAEFTCEQQVGGLRRGPMTGSGTGNCY
jgi:hypothetical protein